MTSNYVFAEDKTSKKGNGVNAVLKLMSETIAFNDKLKTCIESQDNPEAKLEIAKYQGMIESLYKTLVKSAEGGIQSFKDDAVDTVEGVTDDVEEVVKKTPIEPAIVNAPTIPKM